MLSKHVASWLYLLVVAIASIGEYVDAIGCLQLHK